MNKIRTESHFDIAVTYKDGTLHSSSWASEAEAMGTLNRIRKFGIKRAIVWNDVDFIDVDREIVRLLSTKVIHEEEN